MDENLQQQPPTSALASPRTARHAPQADSPHSAASLARKQTQRPGRSPSAGGEPTRACSASPRRLQTPPCCGHAGTSLPTSATPLPARTHPKLLLETAPRTPPSPLCPSPSCLARLLVVRLLSSRCPSPLFQHTRTARPHKPISHPPRPTSSPAQATTQRNVSKSTLRRHALSPTVGEEGAPASLPLRLPVLRPAPLLLPPEYR